MKTAALAILLALPLQGCLFFFVIPGSVFDGNNVCLMYGPKVGDKITLKDGRSGTVQSLAGASSRCQQPNLPVLATLKFD